MLLCFTRPSRAIDGIVMAKPHRATLRGPNRSDASPTAAPKMDGIVMARKIRPAPVECQPKVLLTYMGRTASNAVMTAILMKIPKHAVRIRVDLNRVFVTSNLLEKTNLPSCGSFGGVWPIVWFVEISGSRSLASAPIDSAELFLGLGLVSLPAAKEGDLVCDSTS